MSTQYVDVYLELGWQQELFDFYKGAFKITSYKDGVLEFRCPVLPDTTEVRKKERRNYLQTYEDFKKISEIDPGSDNPYPGRPLQDEELVLRYVVKEKRWEMTVPEGNFPVPYTLHRDMMYLSKERENAMFEREISERRKMGIKPENPRDRPLPPENRR